MDRYSVSERHNPQHAVTKCLYSSPKSNAVVSLNLDADWVFNNQFNPDLRYDVFILCVRETAFSRQIAKKDR